MTKTVTQLIFSVTQPRTCMPQPSYIERSASDLVDYAAVDVRTGPDSSPQGRHFRQLHFEVPYTYLEIVDKKRYIVAEI